MQHESGVRRPGEILMSKISIFTCNNRQQPHSCLPEVTTDVGIHVFTCDSGISCNRFPSEWNVTGV